MEDVLDARVPSVLGLPPANNGGSPFEINQMYPGEARASLNRQSAQMRSRNNYVKESLTVPSAIEQFRQGDMGFDEIKELKRRQ